MSSDPGASPDREAGIARILSFLKAFYQRSQLDEVRRGFESLEGELKGHLRSDEQAFAQALEWVDGLSRGGSRREAKAMPHALATSFAMLANVASVGTDGGDLGSLVPSYRNQLQEDRAPAMRSIIRDHFSKPIVALEIGTWFGKGSTQIWIETLPRASSLFMIDAWSRYITSEDRDGDTNPSYRLMDKLPQAAMTAAVREMFRAEARPGNDIELVLMRGRASRVLGLFREELFDFIYIDGSHYYSEVKRDIALAKSLSKAEFSIVCGDDLETLDPTLIEVARRIQDRDFITYSGVGFHPGVTLAVSEEFEQVNTSNGFWWAIRRNGAWGVV
ncbi:MAG: class I SAM-dependent methyltransferase [Alphaproteobacteria bacterium]|nr:class I SAM-dependent methyltransferase [Alphaproteobacteria bacterium]